MSGCSRPRRVDLSVADHHPGSSMPATTGAGHRRLSSTRSRNLDAAAALPLVPPSARLPGPLHVSPSRFGPADLNDCLGANAPRKKLVPTTSLNAWSGSRRGRQHPRPRHTNELVTIGVMPLIRIHATRAPTTRPAARPMALRRYPPTASSDGSLLRTWSGAGELEHRLAQRGRQDHDAGGAQGDHMASDGRPGRSVPARTPNRPTEEKCRVANAPAMKSASSPTARGEHEWTSRSQSSRFTSPLPVGPVGLTPGRPRCPASRTGGQPAVRSWQALDARLVPRATSRGSRRAKDAAGEPHRMIAWA